MTEKLTDNFSKTDNPEKGKQTMKLVNGTEDTYTIEVTSEEFDLIQNAISTIREQFSVIDEVMLNANKDQIDELDQKLINIFNDYLKRFRGWTQSDFDEIDSVFDDEMNND